MATTSTNDVELKTFVRTSDLAEEPLVPLSPIHAYEQMPLVNLEEAIEPLLSIVPEIKQMLCYVKEHCHEIKDGLTIAESASIMLYSMEWQPKEHSVNLILNRTLRDDNREKLKPWFLYLKLFTKSLSKLPSLHCYVYRAIQEDLSDEYPQGRTFTWWAFALCTRSIETIENDSNLDRTSRRTRFKIECKSAKDIRNHSLHTTTDEVLLLASQRYRVISSIASDSDLHIIQVKEIDSSVAHDRTPSVSLSFSQRTSSIALSIRDSSFYSVVLKLTGSVSAPHHNRHLADLLGLCQDNSCIDLSAREITDQDMPMVIQRAIIDKKCQALYLPGNQIKSPSISILADALYNNFTLTELDLSDNFLSDRSIEMLVDVLSSSKSLLKKLHLGSNRISDRGVQYLSDMLKTNQSLTHLMLNRNSIGNRGVHLLSSVVASQNLSLEILSLSSNSLITDGSVDALIIMLRHNETLKGLDIKYCSISQANNQRLRDIIIEKQNFQLFTNTIENNCVLS